MPLGIAPPCAAGGNGAIPRGIAQLAVEGFEG